MSKNISYTSSSPENLSQIPQKAYVNIDYSKVRILQKNVVYVIGLSSSLANKNILSNYEYFGQYGKIIKIVVNKNGYNQNHHSETTYSAYVSYSTKEEASLALLAIDNTLIDGHVIRGSFGTTKYCTFFLKGIECANKDCLYLHEWSEEEDIIFKDDIGTNRQIFFQQQKIAAQIAGIFNKATKEKILSHMYSNNNSNTTSNNNTSKGFPPIESIYDKENIFELEKGRKYSGPFCYFSGKKNSINNTNDCYNYSNSIKSKNDYNFEKNEEEEVEYVLVKEPNRRKRKWKNQNPNKFQSTLRKAKPKYSLDDFKKRLSLAKNNTELLLNSPGSKSSAMTEASNGSLSQEMNKSLIKYTTRSRFEFAVNEEKNEGMDVPEFIQDLIYLKMASFCFFKMLSKIEDESIFSEELDKIKLWNNEEKSLLFWEDGTNKF